MCIQKHVPQKNVYEEIGLYAQKLLSIMGSIELR